MVAQREAGETFGYGIIGGRRANLANFQLVAVDISSVLEQVIGRIAVESRIEKSADDLIPRPRIAFEICMRVTDPRRTCEIDVVRMCRIESPKGMPEARELILPRLQPGSPKRVVVFIYRDVEPLLEAHPIHPKRVIEIVRVRCAQDHVVEDKPCST